MAKRGKSARRGNASSPYAKYEKKPFRYSAGYYDWKRTVTNSAQRNNRYAAENKQEYSGH